MYKLLLPTALCLFCFLSCDKPEEGTSSFSAAFQIENTGVLSAGCTEVVFVNESVQAESYSWNFGDGMTSEEANPRHTYALAGTYTVVLTARKGPETKTAELTLVITTVPTFEDIILNNWGDSKMVKTQDNGYLVLRTIAIDVNTGKYDFLASKYSQTGQILWSRQYGGAKSELAGEPVAMPDGGFLLVGSSRSFSAVGNHQGYVIRINSEGIVIWTKTFGAGNVSGTDYYFKTGLALGNNKFLAAGNKYYSGFRVGYAYTFDADGNGLQELSFGNGDETFASSSALAADGHVILMGSSRIPNASGGINKQIWVQKFNANDLATMWTFSEDFGNNTDEQGAEIIPAADQGFWVVGQVAFGAASSKMMLIKVSATGQLISQHEFNTNTTGAAIVALADGNLAVTGERGADMYLAKINAGGNQILWEKWYDKIIAYEQGNDIVEASDGGIVISSRIVDGTYQWFWLLKKDCSGN